MGYSKYHQDDLEIYDDRVYNRYANSVSSITTNYTQTDLKTEYSFFCPFCHSGFFTTKVLLDHIITSHGGVHDFVYLNNRKVTSAEQTVVQVFSLILYCFREAPYEIQLRDNIGNRYSFMTQTGIYDYDIHSILKLSPYSELHIDNIDTPVCIKQQLDINTVSISNIISGKYSSSLFVEQMSNRNFTLEGYLVFLKMLIHEGSETDSFIDYIEQIHLENSRELDEIYYYHFLHADSDAPTQRRISFEIVQVLICLLNGDCSHAEATLSEMKGHTNDTYGCKLILSLLKNDKLGVRYLITKYKPFGIIGYLSSILLNYAEYENTTPNFLIHEFDEIKLFKQYPIIQALLELHDSLNHNGLLSYDSYSLLKDLSPLATIQYCYGINDVSIKEILLKSILTTHRDSILIKEYAFKNNCDWFNKRIFVSDGNLYKKAVLKQNKNFGSVFSERFIEKFPFDDQIKITPLGGEHEIGASCFVISYKSYNIMLDCGINVNKFGDDAYPFLDLWGEHIDAIIISHAHIDHSGGVPKAHAMWSDANIVATAPTKIFLKYIYSDMAKVKNGIADELEIENINIEKSIMQDTLNSMTTLEYEKWVYFGEDIKIRLHPAGHIIGAAMIELMINGKVLLYTGDYCNHNQALTRSFEFKTLPQHVDYLITESTYFKKAHIDFNRQYDELHKAILKSINEGRAILLPATSIGRSQELVCIIGEMKLSGEIPENITLYIAGMAIPASTQIIPFMNERYKRVIGTFKELNGAIYPENNAIIIASSGSMTKGSASYNISKYWDNRLVDYTILASGYLDEDSESESKSMDRYTNIQRLSLSTHTDLYGILDLIEFVSPKVISFVHRGSRSETDINTLVKMCKSKFSNDILYRDLKANQCDKIFDMHEWLIKGASKHG